METTEGIGIGQVVRSKAGRDKNKFFVVINVIDDRYVLLVDGDMRKLDTPKKKKIKHLVVYNYRIEELRQRLEKKIKINNAFIRKMLSAVESKLQ
ncbi:KOW domain-containing RNA-binding protein [Clostridiisalibacter paucivorans]|uniref:KOW domain-containing RNA-binding protein n=1 Tax=Clostridiisalibacter paucivorans TaxID=408753 RepID=UPI00047941C6|nr:KOW domain-containing RNA-binding protein [Clostridiisalibacter paucivorans]